MTQRSEHDTHAFSSTEVGRASISSRATLCGAVARASHAVAGCDCCETISYSSSDVGISSYPHVQVSQMRNLKHREQYDLRQRRMFCTRALEQCHQCSSRQQCDLLSRHNRCVDASGLSNAQVVIRNNYIEAQTLQGKSEALTIKEFFAGGNCGDFLHRSRNGKLSAAGDFCPAW